MGVKGPYRIVLISVILVLAGPAGFCQDQRVADSLIQLYNQKPNARDSLRLSWLHDIAFNHSNPDSSLYYANTLSQSTEDPYFLYLSFMVEGSAHRMLGNLEESLQAFFKSLEMAPQTGLAIKEGLSYAAIGDVYSTSGAHENSILYYRKAIEVFRENDASASLSTVLFNLGDEYLKQDSLAQAAESFEAAGVIFERMGFTPGLAYVHGSMGVVYARQGSDEIALEELERAIRMLEEQEDFYAISDYLPYLSDLYWRQGNTERALSYAQRSLQLSPDLGLKEQISMANQKLSERYEQLGNSEASLEHYKAFVSYRDSVKNLESMQEMADMRTNFEVSQKQAEVDLLNQQRRTQRIVVIATIIALVLIGIIAVGLYRRNRFVRKTNRIIERERARSDSLLLNILPEETAEELKENGRVEAKRFESVSILFTDFKGFTNFAEKMSPETLVERIDYYFSRFDTIIEKHGLEKIKTIGDAYMCVGGLPFPLENHAEKAVEAALEIAAFVRDSMRSVPKGQPIFDIRIGINTGPVIAGVVGTKKFAYDIWGDAVNVAARMESNSAPGRINVSEHTHQLIKGRYECEYRGLIEAKNRGKLKMYFVNQLEPATHS